MLSVQTIKKNPSDLAFSSAGMSRGGPDEIGWVVNAVRRLGFVVEGIRELAAGDEELCRPEPVEETWCGFF